MANYGLGRSNAVENVFADPYSDVSSLNSVEKRSTEYNRIIGNENKYNNHLSHSTILNIRSYVFECEQILKKLSIEIDDNLHMVNINPYVNINLETAHGAVWKDAIKHSNQIIDTTAPNFICYEEYLFANKHQCRACREFIKQYELAIGHTSYGYLLHLKKVLEYLHKEVLIIKNIVTYYLGEDYRDETEGEIAKHLADWSKAVTHYSKQFAAEITSKSISLPQSELDQISKKQAAQFQAFFSLRVNSVVSEILSVSALIKRDSVDVAPAFYDNYLMPALTFKSKLVEPLMLDINTSNLSRNAPMLVGEMFIASNAITGNLGSVTTDLVERRITVGKRLSALVELFRLNRRYINFIINLEEKGFSRVKPLSFPIKEDVDKITSIFEFIDVDSSKRESLRSSHNDLDDLDGDPHPQYIKASGGKITGDIYIESGTKIGGIDFVNHSHNFQDGSSPISADSIDYSSARSSYYESTNEKPYSNIVLTGFQSTLKIGGVHENSAVFEIDIEDDKLNAYDFEILYKEL